MAKNPSTLWFFNDSANELTLRLCSMAARGFWMEMLAIAANATPRGQVKIGDKPCTICDLARYTAQDKRMVSRWVRDLERHGVFSRTEDGTIFCRRMVREAEARKPRTKGVAGRRTTRAEPSYPLRAPNQADLFDNPKKTRTRTRDSDSGSFATTQDSTSTDKPETLDAACEEEKTEDGNPEGGRCAPLGGREREGRCRPPGPARPTAGESRPRPPPGSVRRPQMQRAEQQRRDGGGHSPKPDGQAVDLPLEVGFDRGEVGPHRDDDRLRREIVVDHAADLGRNALGGLARHAAAFERPGQGQTAGHRPDSTRKSPTLRAKIREQLKTKHLRFLKTCRPAEEVSAYYLIVNEDSEDGTRVFEAVDARMRALHWDDMRQWKTQHGIAENKAMRPISTREWKACLAVLHRVGADLAGPMPKPPLDTWRRREGAVQ